MASFHAAVEAGFAIECDLQVTKTGEPVVFHDPRLDRMTDVSGNVCDKTPQELAELKLLDTADGIYTLQQHLDAVAGQVPIVLELKDVEGKDAGFVEGVAKSIDGYKGDLCVMSFDHWICAQFAKLMPDIPRGLTAEGDDDACDRHMNAMIDFDLQFVSYGVKDLPNIFVAKMREAGLPVITWTVRDEETCRLTAKHADQMTFEGFDPRTLSDEFQNG